MPKTTFIESLTPTTGRVTDWFQVAQVDRKTKKEGGGFLALKLRDRTGEVSGNLWDIPDGLELKLKAGDVVKVDAETGEYRGALQLKFARVRLATPDEISKDDYVPASKQDRDRLIQKVDWGLRSILDEPLRAATTSMLSDFYSSLRDAPAAKTNHQAYLGGLLEHILNLMGLANSVCERYDSLNRDILVAACFLHDIGKVGELCCDTHIGYTRSGTLVGHVILGAIMFDRYAGAISPETRDHLAHIIASHHGNLEWGAAKVPMTREAHVFHLLDMIDSKMGLLDNILAGPVDADGFTPYNNKIGSAVWNGK